MKTILKILSFTALACIIIPPLLYLGEVLSKPDMKVVMLVGTILWFATVPWWIGKSEPSEGN